MNRRAPDRAALVEVARRALNIYESPTWIEESAERIVSEYLAEQEKP